jgi:glucose dehydrogenase
MCLMQIRFALFLLFAAAAVAQTKPGDWPMYNHDIGSTRYSALNQITTSNVAKLTQAWTFTTRPANAPPPNGKAKGGGRGGAGIGSEAVPIVINNVMYLPAGNLVVAVAADTGKEVWRYQLAMGAASSRGVAYWPGDKQNGARIIFTAGRNLIALNASTGKLDPGFGKEGVVDMVIGYSGVPTILNNVVSVGASVNEVEVGPPGNTRAFDARTGAKIWEFKTVAQPGDPGHETWLNDGWKDRSGTNIWAWAMSGDVAR